MLQTLLFTRQQHLILFLCLFYFLQQQQLHQQGLPHIHAPPISLPHHGGHPPHLPAGVSNVIELSGIMPPMPLMPGIKDEKGTLVNSFQFGVTYLCNAIDKMLKFCNTLTLVLTLRFSVSLVCLLLIIVDYFHQIIQ